MGVGELENDLVWRVWDVLRRICAISWVFGVKMRGLEGGSGCLDANCRHRLPTECHRSAFFLRDSLRTPHHLRGFARGCRNGTYVRTEPRRRDGRTGSLIAQAEGTQVLLTKMCVFLRRDSGCGAKNAVFSGRDSGSRLFCARCFGWGWRKTLKRGAEPSDLIAGLSLRARGHCLAWSFSLGSPAAIVA